MKQHQKNTANGRGAFSRIDLLVCLVAISVLGLLSFASMAKSTGDSRWLVSMSNMKQLTSAWVLYAKDHNDRLAPSTDGANAGKTSQKAAWAGGWLDYNSQNQDNTNSSYLVDPYGKGADGVTRHYSGLLGYYVRDPRLFVSPNDASSINLFGVAYPRVRSVSMNHAMLGSTRLPSGWQSNLRNAGYKLFSSLSDFGKSSPAQTFVLITEGSDSINDAMFVVDIGSTTMVDQPSSVENGGANLSFADGHVENWQWRSDKFREAPKGFAVSQEPLSSPDAFLDLKRLESVTSSK